MNYSSYHSAAFDALLRKADAEKDLTRGQDLGPAGDRCSPTCRLAQFFPFQRPLVKRYVTWINNPRQINRTRWLDIADHVATAGRLENERFGCARASVGDFGRGWARGSAPRLGKSGGILESGAQWALAT